MRLFLWFSNTMGKNSIFLSQIQQQAFLWEKTLICSIASYVANVEDLAIIHNYHLQFQWHNIGTAERQAFSWHTIMWCQMSTKWNIWVSLYTISNIAKAITLKPNKNGSNYSISPLSQLCSQTIPTDILFNKLTWYFEIELRRATTYCFL